MKPTRRGRSELDLLGQLEGIVHLNAEVLTVLSHFLWPSRSWQARTLPVFLLTSATLERRRLCVPYGPRPGRSSAPRIDQAGILARADVVPCPAAAGEEPVVSAAPAERKPSSQCLASRFGNLEGHGTAGLLLDHCRSLTE